MTENILSLRNIYKKYSSTNIEACKNINLDIYKGEVFALLGDNGAGKTTLVKLIAGFEKANRGSIDYYGNENFVQMAHQHSKVFYNLSVLENVILGNEPKIFGLFVNIKKAKKIIFGIIRDYNFNLDINTKVKHLSNTQIKELEIVKCLYNDAKFIILDEPTSSMNIKDANIIYSTISKLKSKGITVFIITHKIKEIISVSDRVAIMKEGEIESVYNSEDIDYDFIINKLLGNTNIIEPLFCQINRNENREHILRLENIACDKNIHGFTKLDNISFNLEEGEILAVIASDGNGLNELEEILSKFIMPTGGHIFYKNNDITKYSTKQLRGIGISYVPSRKIERGVSLESNLSENIIISKTELFTKKCILNKRLITEYTNKVLNYMNISRNHDTLVKTLSGGNIQRLIVSREINSMDKLIILSEPTQGVDIKTTKIIHEQIVCLKNSGNAVLLLSSSVSEVIKIADRIIVLYRGSIIKEIINKNIDEKMLSKYITGSDL